MMICEYQPRNMNTHQMFRNVYSLLGFSPSKDNFMDNNKYSFIPTQNISDFGTSDDVIGS